MVHFVAPPKGKWNFLGSIVVMLALGELPEAILNANSDAHERGASVPTVTESEVNQLARDTGLCFLLRDAEVHGIVPLAPHIALAQSLAIALDGLGCGKRWGVRQREAIG